MSKFNLFGTDDRPIETFGEVIFKESHGEIIPSNESASLETVNAYDMDDRRQMSAAALSNKRNFLDGVCMEAGPRKKALIFTKTICKETESCCWEFFLDAVCFTVTNDFITKLEQVKENDCILIHGPACCYTDDAEVICAAISRCKAKEKLISSPYILDIGAASILLTATKIIHSVCNLIRLSPPRVSGGGAMQDARMAFENNVYRNTIVIKNLLKAGFITQDEYNHLVEEQGGVCLHGKRLKEIIDIFNQKHA